MFESNTLIVSSKKFLCENCHAPKNWLKQSFEILHRKLIIAKIQLIIRKYEKFEIQKTICSTFGVRLLPDNLKQALI